ncbi:TetR/AcrR family transcriptional regulator [Amycolatopsis acidicola]|uniref:TetR/AcrR family transcriptional regulator n=1 Tax=Amycolatopsis acidicola TaxID=2596893 RepID=A0A5N0UP20_9PSEU|nr:TetR/AcrR family transcriptional regulator [Amycolatopsis acidicola]KAA9151765.1 TetR/AcrR family transcriptional regulator [Amycolatopsis acidicola]
MTADPETRLRADARRNRDQILAAAKQMFFDDGPDVPMEEIARAAGVGVGTLYRRFPDREALIRAVAQDNFARVLTEARAAAEEPTGWQALVRLLGQSRELQLSVRLALVSPQASVIIREDRGTQEFRNAILDVLDDIVHRAQDEGSLRADVSTGDVAIVVSLLLRRFPAKGETAELMIERVLALLLEGLRARPDSVLPGRPITVEDLYLR